MFRPSLASLLLALALALGGCTSAPPGHSYGRHSVTGGGPSALGVHGQGNPAAADAAMNAAIIAPPEVMLVILAGALLWEVGKEIDKELDDLDVTIDAPFPAMRKVAEDSLFDLGFDDLRVKDTNDSARIIAHNAQMESVFVKLKATGEDALLTRVSIYAGEDKELVEQIAETMKTNLGYTPEVIEVNTTPEDALAQVEEETRDPDKPEVVQPGL